MSVTTSGTPDFRSSSLVAALEATWQAIQARHADLPRAVIIVAPGIDGEAVPHWGHWWAARWQVEGGAVVGEVKLSGERLKDGPELVLETLLHEAAHALAFARNIKDTSRGARYHNRRYKALAEAVGLTARQMGAYGYTDTALAEGTAARYQPQLQGLKQAIADSYRRSGWGVLSVGSGDTLGGDDDHGKGDKAPSGAAGAGGAADDRADHVANASRRILYLCSCRKPRKLRMSASVFELGPLSCGVCGEDFREAEEG